MRLLSGRGRLQQEKYFVFQNVSDQVIVFVPPDFTADMVLVDSTHRLKAQRKVLQVGAAFDYFHSHLIKCKIINAKIGILALQFSVTQLVIGIQCQWWTCPTIDIIYHALSWAWGSWESLYPSDNSMTKL